MKQSKIHIHFWTTCLLVLAIGSVAYAINNQYIATSAANNVSLDFGAAQWIAGIYLGVGGGALAFILWVLALERATPTRVAATMTINPLAAGLLATQLVGEPITPNLVFGLVAVFAGIWIATSEARVPAPLRPRRGQP